MQGALPIGNIQQMAPIRLLGQIHGEPSKKKENLNS